MTILSIYWISDTPTHEHLFLGMLDTQPGHGYANHPRYGGYPWAETCQVHRSPTLFTAIESLCTSERLAREHPAGITHFDVIDEHTGSLDSYRPLPMIPFLLPDPGRAVPGPSLGANSPPARLVPWEELSDKAAERDRRHAGPAAGGLQDHTEVEADYRPAKRRR